MSDHYDVLFLGSSPNALAGAARLAKAGRRVLVLEPRAVAGGPVATEELAPGFRADTGVSSLALDGEIARELGLSLEPIQRDSVTILGAAPVTLRASDSLLPEALVRAIELVRAIQRMDPPDVPAGETGALAGVGARLAALGQRGMHEVLRLSFMSARDYFEENIAGDAARAAMASVAVRALSEGPFAQGTLFGFLHHAAIGDGLFRSTAKGGVQSIAAALSAAAVAAGADVRTGVDGAIAIDVQEGVARGASTPAGAFTAGAVVSDFDARATFTRFVRPSELDPEFNRALRAIRYRGSVARVHLLLDRLPDFRGVDRDALRGTLLVADDLNGIERAWDCAKRGIAPAHPMVEATVPTLADPSLAPQGRHVLDAWVQYIPYKRADKGAVLKSVVDQLVRYAPDLPAAISGHHVSLPEDLEQRFGLTEGHLYGGEVRLEQTFFLRPLPGYAHYETPIENLYLAGGAAHPGGYSGLSGWNLAARLLSKTS